MIRFVEGTNSFSSMHEEEEDEARQKDSVRLVHESQHDDELGARQKDKVRCTEDASLLWDRCAVKKEVYELFDFAWPLVCTFTLFYVANIVSMAFVGQLGPVDLAAAGPCFAAASPITGAGGRLMPIGCFLAQGSP